MKKGLIKAGLLACTALTFVLTSHTPAEAGPLFGIIAGIFGAIASGASIAQIVIGVALKVGMTLLQMALTPEQQVKPVGVKLQVEVGDDKPVSAVIGTFATSGKRKYIGSYGDIGGTPNSHLTEVIEVSSIPVGGLSGLWMDGQKCTILYDEPSSRGYPLEEYRVTKGSTKTDYAWIRFYDGTQTAADSYMLGKFGDHDKRPWTASMVGRGCAYAVMTYRWKRDLFRGQPSVAFELLSIPLYDIRKDSTNGGNGDHRWTDPATWEPSVNMAVMAYNVARGIYYHGEWFYGGQNVAAHRLPSSAWIAAAQECGRLIDNADGSRSAQFRGGFEITGDAQPSDTLDELRKGMNARLVDSAGTLKIKVGAMGAAVYAFTDADIIVTKEQGFDPFPTLDQTINAVYATYPEPAEQWAGKDAPALRDAALEARDGKLLPASIQFRAVPHRRQVQRLMRAALKEERRFRTHQIWLPPAAYALEPGIDVVAWTSAHNGYNAKKFLVVEIAGDPTMNQLVTLQEVDPSDYDWSSEFEMPSSTGWLGRIDAPDQPMDVWGAAPSSVEDASGTGRRPSILVSYAGDQDDVESVWIRVRVKATGKVVYSARHPYDGDIPQTNVHGAWCLPVTHYEVTGKFVPYSSRSTSWAGWIEVLTEALYWTYDDLAIELRDVLDTLVSWIDGDLPGSVANNAADILAEAQARAAAMAGLADDIAAQETARIDDAFAAAARARDIASRIDAIALQVAELDYSSYDARQELRRQISATIASTRAEFDERITVAASATAAISQRVATLEADTTDLSALITAIDTARVDEDEALASQLALLSVGTVTQFDHARIWYFDTAAEGWTGSPSGPSVISAGYLRPASGSGSAIVSPDIAVAGITYGQMRARLARTGAPDWAGYLWWRRSGEAFDAARRVAIPEPAWADDIGLISINAGWAGEIVQVRLDLADAPSATDFIELDWIAIGRPSPGASSADLLAERQARIAADSAMASNVVALQTGLTDATTALNGTTSAVESLTGEVSSINGTLATQVSALTALNQEIAGKADSSAVDEMIVSALAGVDGGVVINGRSMRALRQQLDAAALETVEHAAGGRLQQIAARGALTQASQAMTTRIDATNAGLSVVSEMVTIFAATIPNLANANAVQALTERVDATESAITSSSNAITSLQNDLDVLENDVASKASSSALSSMASTVTSQGNALSSQGNAILSLQNDLDVLESDVAGKASSSALSSMASTVTSQGNALSSQGNAILSLQNDLDVLENDVAGKASASALSSMASTVAWQGGVMTSLSDGLTLLNSEVDAYSAEGRMRVTTEATPSGAVARIGFRVATSGSAGASAAAMFLEASSDGRGRAVFEVDQLGIVTGGGTQTPFSVDENGVYIDSAYLRTITTEKISFLDGSVQTSAMAQNAAIAVPYYADASTLTHSGGTTQIGSVVASKSIVDIIIVQADVRIRCTAKASSDPMNATIELRDNGVWIGDATLVFTETGITQSANLQGAVISGTGTRTITLHVSKDRVGDLLIARRTITAIVAKKAFAI